MDSETIRYDTTKFDEKLPVVCERCNSTWMSVLTHKTKETFGRAMLEGEPFTLNVKDTELLAAFTFMKAVVTYHSLTDEPFFPRAATDLFRDSLVIPDAVQCWFAAYDGLLPMTTVARAHVFSPKTEHPLFGYQFLGFTYIVGKLALELLAPRWKDVSHRGNPLKMIRIHDPFIQATIRFWPDVGKSVSWPPSEHIGSDSIQLFVDRLGGPIEGHPKIPR